MRYRCERSNCGGLLRNRGTKRVEINFYRVVDHGGCARRLVGDGAIVRRQTKITLLGHRVSLGNIATCVWVHVVPLSLSRLHGIALPTIGLSRLFMLENATSEGALATGWIRVASWWLMDDAYALTWQARGTEVEGSSGVGYRGTQLLERWGSRLPLRGLVDAACQPDSRASTSARERVHTVDEDARRAAEGNSFGFIKRLHAVVGHSNLRSLGRDHGEPVVGDLPVWAVIKVEQCDIHVSYARPYSALQGQGKVQSMLIGELAETVGLDSQTIRFYERQGVLPEPQRSANGYRVYDNTSVNRLRFIRSAQTAGLTLAQITGVVDLRDHGQAPCTHVKNLLTTKLDAVRARQAELLVLETELEQLIERGAHLDPADCTDADVCSILASDGNAGLRQGNRPK